MENCKQISTPLEFGKHFGLKGENESSADKRLFQSAIGCLVYAATAIKSDLSTSVRVLSKFMSDLSIDHCSIWVPLVPCFVVVVIII